MKDPYKHSSFNIIFTNKDKDSTARSLLSSYMHKCLSTLFMGQIDAQELGRRYKCLFSRATIQQKGIISLYLFNIHASQ